VKGFENASEDFKAANPELFFNEVSSLASLDVVKDEVESLEILERDFQADCERWLMMRGYGRRTEKAILEGDVPALGWFFHLVKPVGNPLLLDLLLLGNDGRFLEVELKTATGAVRSFQGVLVRTFEPAVLVRTFVDFVGVVTKWENSNGEDL